MQKLIAIMFGIFLFGNVSAQQIDLTLDEAIELARQKSFEAFKAKNMYLDKALDYQTYLKLLYPKASLSFRPGEYDRSISEQWNSIDNRFESSEYNVLRSSGNLDVSKNVGFTGGSLSLSSDLSRREDYNYKRKNSDPANYEGVDYTASPISLTYSQDFSKINSFKWRAKIDPIAFEQATKQYLEDVEQVTLTTISLFFRLLNAEMNYKIAQLNKNNTDTLLLFGKKKLEIGAITRDNYLKLQLKKVNAGITLESRLLSREEARFAFNNFLELPRETSIICLTPSRIPNLAIPYDEAIAKTFINNPNMISITQKLLVAERNVKAAKANRFSADFLVTVGLNRSQPEVVDAYRDLSDQQSISFKLSVPILDWGDTKRAIVQAKLNKDLVEESARKQRDGIELDVLNMVNEFNIKRSQVDAAAQADSISQIAYEAVKQQFMLGKASVLDINTSYTDMQSAQNSYLNSLNNFWTQLYSIRKLCLYDFEKQIDLDADFDKMLNEYH